MFYCFKKSILISGLATLPVVCLAGCGVQESKKNITPITAPATSQAFDTWRLEKCSLQASNEHITLRTDGNESHETLRLQTRLPQQPQRPPLISVLGIGGVDLNLTGRNKNWSFELPNTPYSAAQMMAGRAYVVVEYTPVPTTRLPTPGPVTATFSLKQLPKAVLRLYEKCENQKKN